MNVLVLDCETKVTWLEDKRIDNSPFNVNNKLVSVNWRKLETVDSQFQIGDNNVSIFHHNEYLEEQEDEFDFDELVKKPSKHKSDPPNELQRAIDWADCIVAHNAKYDLVWLLECGFNFDDKIVWDTMVGEYILACGVKKPLSLKETAIRRNTTLKKSDLTEEYFKNGIGFEAMPLSIVLEYADADVLSCAEIFIKQLIDFGLNTELEPDNPPNKLHQIARLMNDMLWFLVEIERNGIHIDLDALSEVEKEFKAELVALEKRMNEIIAEVMGDTPINLRSGDDITKVVYSREVFDKERHKTIFNLGKDAQGKVKFPPFMTPTKFANSVKSTTRKVYRTTAEQCFNCIGRGYIIKVKKDGTPFKKSTICSVCSGDGMLYLPSTTIAGFKLIPTEAADASVGGFKVDKDTLDKLIEQARDKSKNAKNDSVKYINDLAIEFLEAKKRLNALNVYLDSFVLGIQRWTRPDGLLHANFNQTIASTGRLSSDTPNFQNQPRGGTFPVRRAITSRFEGGCIIEADFSGLEFVVAGELSRDPQIIADIENGKDIHKQTASIVHKKPVEEVNKGERTLVKPHTFAPLYGATGYGQLPHIKAYYEAFFTIYVRHGEWQTEQAENVLKYGYVETPSGRQYAFPYAKRTRTGKVSDFTKIVNWPVQGFATGDIVPLACIRALRLFRLHKLKSLLILTVHDSIVVDCYPGEEELVYRLLHEAMVYINNEIKQRWGYDMYFTLKCEIESGPNWLDKKVMEINIKD